MGALNKQDPLQLRLLPALTTLCAVSVQRTGESSVHTHLSLTYTSVSAHTFALTLPLPRRSLSFPILITADKRPYLPHLPQKASSATTLTPGLGYVSVLYALSHEHNFCYLSLNMPRSSIRAQPWLTHISVPAPSTVPLAQWNQGKGRWKILPTMQAQGSNEKMVPYTG